MICEVFFGGGSRRSLQQEMNSPILMPRDGRQYRGWYAQARHGAAANGIARFSTSQAIVSQTSAPLADLTGWTMGEPWPCAIGTGTAISICGLKTGRVRNFGI